MLSDWLWLGVLVALLWYWWDTVRTKELARLAGLRACQQAQVQFLDDTVARRQIRLRRNTRGRMQLRRLYGFEFTSDGEHRYQGRIEMQGQQVRRVDMDPYRITEG